MGRTGRSVCAVLMGCIFAGSGMVNAGDIQDEQQVFEQVSSKLDKGGINFLIQNNKYTYKEIARVFDSFQQLISTQPNIAAEQPQIPMLMQTAKSLAVGLGLNELKAYGSSSTLIEPETANQPPLFRNRLYFLHGKEIPQGLLWQLAGNKNHDLDAIYLLPRNTVYAVSCDFNPAKIWAWVKNFSQQLPMPAYPMLMQAEVDFQQKYQIALPELLSQIGGNWTMAVIYKKSLDSGKPLMQGILIVPSADQKLFGLMTKLIEEKDRVVDLKNLEIKMNIPENAPLAVREMLNPVIKQEGNVLYFASAQAILTEVKSASAKHDGLVSTPGYKRLAQNLPMSGVSFAFIDGAFGKDIFEMIQCYSGSKEVSGVSSFVCDSAMLSVASIEGDGVLVTANGSQGFNGMESMQAVTVPILAGMLLPALNSAREKARTISCASNLKQIGLASMQYAMDHKDQFPAKDNAEGLNELVKGNYLTDPQIFVCPSTDVPAQLNNGVLADSNCGYIYFGGFNSTAEQNLTIPLAFDKPANHLDSINIAFTDGHVAVFNGMRGQFNSCAAVVNFLNKQNHYEPKMLKQLLEKADKIDKEFGYSK